MTAWARAVLAFIVTAVLVSACSGEPPSRLIVRHDRGVVDVARLEKAAAPLLARGADVAVFVVDKGDDTGQDLTKRLQADQLGFASQAGVAPSAIAIYVSYAPRYSELRAGSRWSEFLPSVTLRAIRDRTLNAALRRTDGDPADGIVATLAALDTAVASGQELNTTIGRVVLIGVGALLVGLGIAALLAGRLSDLRRGWPRSWLGRAWAATPFGSWQARRANRREVEIAKSSLAQSDRSARQRSEQSGVADAALDAERAALETMRAELFARSPDDPILLGELRTLAERYSKLVENTDQAVRDVRVARGRVEAAAERVGEVFTAAKQNLGSNPRSGAGTGVVAQITLHASDFEALEQTRTRLSEPARAIAHADLTGLEARYGEVEAAVLALWQQAAPEARAAFSADMAARLAKRRQRRPGTAPGDDGARERRDGSTSNADPIDSGGQSSSDGGPW